MTRLKFRDSILEEPFHDTKGSYIGVTKDAETAEKMAATNVSLMRIPQHKWPKGMNELRKKIRFVIKEAGERNFLVVVNE